jgi:hypothetical protein
VPPLKIHLEINGGSPTTNYFQGSMVYVDIYIKNLTLADLNSISIQQISGHTAFEFSKQTFHLDMRFGLINSIRIGGEVVARPGKYKAFFQLYSELYREPVGEAFSVAVEVSHEGFFRRKK